MLDEKATGKLAFAEQIIVGSYIPLARSISTSQDKKQLLTGSSWVPLDLFPLATGRLPAHKTPCTVLTGGTKILNVDQFFRKRGPGGPKFS